MRLLSIALLFSYCFIGSANQGGADKADCNDQTVFEAADEVLRSLNYAKEDGNQFALYRITEAAKKEESGRVQVFITFEMQESVCGVRNGIDWQRCAFKANDADFGECSAQVLVNTEPNSEEITNSEVIWKNCSTVKGWQPKLPKQKVLEPPVSVVQHPCLGCYQVIDTNSEMLLPIIQAAIEKMNRVGNHQFHFDLENFTKAEQQVVSGWNYKLEYQIRQTNCSKSLYPKWSPAECSLDKNGQGGDCFTQVFVTPNEEIKDIYLACRSITGFCLNCPDEVEVTDPELQNLLKQFIEEYNSNSNHTNLYKVQKVESATRKLVENKKQYTAKFRIKETNCSKSDQSIMGEECGTEPMGSDLYCEANINVADEPVDVLQDYTCNRFHAKEAPQRISIKGLSPLRSIPILAMSQRRKTRSSEKSKHKGNEPHGKHGKEQKKDKKDKENKNGKHGHKNGKHDHSSEESAEENRHRPQQLPKPPQHIPRVPEIDTNVLVTTTQQVKPTSADKVVGPPSTQRPSLLPPDVSQPSPLKPTVQDEQGTYPTINETVILDLPVLSPEDAPRCPGKLWQPLLPNLHITTDKPFVIGGVVFNDDDLLL